MTKTWTQLSWHKAGEMVEAALKMDAKHITVSFTGRTRSYDQPEFKVEATW